MDRSELESWVVGCARGAASAYARKYPMADNPRWHYVGVAWERIARLVARGVIDPSRPRARGLAVRAGVLACMDEYRQRSHHRTQLKTGRPVRFVSSDEPLTEDADGPTVGDMIAAPDPVPSDGERLAALWAETRGDRQGRGMIQRVRLYLWLVEGWTHEEIASYSGVVLSAVSNGLREFTAGLNCQKVAGARTRATALKGRPTP